MCESDIAIWANEKTVWVATVNWRASYSRETHYGSVPLNNVTHATISATTAEPFGLQIKYYSPGWWQWNPKIGDCFSVYLMLWQALCSAARTLASANGLVGREKNIALFCQYFVIALWVCQIHNLVDCFSDWISSVFVTQPCIQSSPSSRGPSGRVHRCTFLNILFSDTHVRRRLRTTATHSSTRSVALHQTDLTSAGSSVTNTSVLQLAMGLIDSSTGGTTKLLLTGSHKPWPKL